MVLEGIHHVGCDLVVRMQKSSQLFQLQYADLTKDIRQSLVATHLIGTYNTSFDKTAIAWETRSVSVRLKALRSARWKFVGLM